MQIVDQARQQREQWREGVATFPLISAAEGSSQFCIFEQVRQPGHGAPAQRHAVEEVLEVTKGCAEIFVAAESGFAGVSQSVLIPAGVSHSFRNSGDKTLRVRATLASPAFEAIYESSNKVSRRWIRGCSAACG